MNENARYFKMPEDFIFVHRLILAIPNTWMGLGGSLVAPEDSSEFGRVAKNTKMMINGLHHKFSVHFSGGTKPDETELEDLLIFHHQPQQIIFEGFDDLNPEKFEAARRLIIGFLSKGYVGYLRFMLNFDRNRLDYNKARCSLQFSTWSGALFMEQEAGIQPARIKVEFDPTLGGTEEDVKPIIDACQFLDLEEYLPIGNVPQP